MLYLINISKKHRIIQRTNRLKKGENSISLKYKKNLCRLLSELPKYRQNALKTKHKQGDPSRTRRAWTRQILIKK